jgi:hypothetical protein
MMAIIAQFPFRWGNYANLPSVQYVSFHSCLSQSIYYILKHVIYIIFILFSRLFLFVKDQWVAIMLHLERKKCPLQLIFQFSSLTFHVCTNTGINRKKGYVEIKYLLVRSHLRIFKSGNKGVVELRLIKLAQESPWPHNHDQILASFRHVIIWIFSILVNVYRTIEHIYLFFSVSHKICCISTRVVKVCYHLKDILSFPTCCQLINHLHSQGYTMLCLRRITPRWFRFFLLFPICCRLINHLHFQGYTMLCLRRITPPSFRFFLFWCGCLFKLSINIYKYLTAMHGVSSSYYS